MRFSVIIPVYNKANTISSSLDSVFAQTNQDFEVIVVNDGSTDNIHQVLSKYERVIVINQENAGVSVARNAGIDKAKGDFVCFLDADDVYFPNHLEVLSGLIDKYPDCGFFCTSHKETVDDGNKTDSATRLPKYVIESSDYKCDNLFDLLNNYSDGIIHTNSFCIKKYILINGNIYFAVGEKIGEDTDLWYRVALKNSIVLTRITTTQYQREYSTATKMGVKTKKWLFAKRIDSIMRDSSIPNDIKDSVLLLVDRYFLKCARDYKLEGCFKEAIGELKKVTYKWNKRYILSAIYCYLPCKISRMLKKNI